MATRLCGRFLSESSLKMCRRATEIRRVSSLARKATSAKEWRYLVPPARFLWMSSCLNAKTYEDIPGLLRKTLQEKNQDDDVTESQMRVLDKLIQGKKGKTEDAGGPAKELTPDDVYNLAVAVFGTQDTVGGDAIELAVPLFRTAAMAGSTNGKYTYAQLLQMGQGVEQDPVEAGVMFTELAEKGHPFAQFSLAQMYYSGHGVQQDFKVALSLLEVSAQNGICEAHALLGDMYKNGQGVEEDQVKAAEAYRRGVECGDAGAMMSLARCYSQGLGVEQDPQKVFEYHAAAADQGHPTAQHNVAVHYFSGQGVAADMKEAARYFSLAADQDFELSQINLGNMYYNGIGVERDISKAKELYSQAAKTNKNAQLLLQELEEEMARPKDT